MKSLFRRYTALSLVLLLVLTSQAMAVARGNTGPTGQMVLCTGTGPVMVYVDENGTPTAPPRYCPDTALSLLAAVTVPDVALTVWAPPRRAPVKFAPELCGGLILPPCVARGPPFVV